MEKENQLCLIDSYTPEELVKIFQEKEDCTSELISLFKTATYSNLRKLQSVFLAVENYDIGPLIEETHSPNRMTRYNSSFILLSKVKKILKTKRESALIDDLYTNVFRIRLRDIDPHVRAMMLQFLSEWARTSAIFLKEERLKDLAEALLDKSDLVRRKALRAVYRVSRHIVGRKGLASSFGSLPLVSENTREKILHLALHDTNQVIRRESSLLVYFFFRFNSELFSEKELLSVALRDKSNSAEKTKALEGILPDRISVLERVHEVLDVVKSIEKRPEVGASEASCNDLDTSLVGSAPGPLHLSEKEADLSPIFLSLNISEMELKDFISAVVSFAREAPSGGCCPEQRPYLCFLDVLRALATKTVPADYKELLAVTKDNRHNIKKILQALSHVTCFPEHSEDARDLLYMLREVVTEYEECLEEFVGLLAALKDVFPHYVDDLVMFLRPQHTSVLIRSFDLSSSLDYSSAKSLDKCYAALWLITRRDFQTIKVIQLSDADKFYDLVLFLEFFATQAARVYGSEWSVQMLEKEPEDVYDVATALVFMASRLYEVVRTNFNFCDETSALYLFKLIDIGLFEDKANILFEVCSLDVLTEMIVRTKASRAFVSGYLVAVSDSKRLASLAKTVASKVSKSEDNQYVFSHLKRCMDKKWLLDEVLPYFVPFLSLDSLLFLENSAPKSKFKTACMRRIRLIGRKEQSTSPV